MGDGKSPGDAMRKKAIALHAADAGFLLNSTLPHVLRQMTPAQVRQVQRIMDAAVVNPGIQKQADDLYRRSILGRIGNQFYRDPNLVRRADRVRGTMIAVTEADKRIRLNVDALLEAGALKPVSDNPDEAEYLAKVKATLERRGVWLRIGQPWVRRPDDPSAVMISPQVFQVWLSLGPDGDQIPTQDGRIDRDALLNTTTLGAGYYTQVDRGPVQKALEREITRLTLDIEEGVQEHNRLRARYRHAAPGVAEISDFVGGADLPDISIWDYPTSLVLKARQANIHGNVMAPQTYLVVAAIATRNAAQLLADYAEKSGAGAAGVVSVLKVLKTAGEVAEVGLAITGVVGLARGAITVAGAGTAADASVDELAEKLVKQYAAKNPEVAADLDKVRWVPGPRGTVSGRMTPGSGSRVGTGFHKWP
jgi:hypothetical protein